MPDIAVQQETGGAEQVSPPALDTEAQATPQASSAESAEPLSLTVEGAIVLALQHNQNLSVQEVNPALQHTFVSEQRSVFDPVLVGSYTRTRGSPYAKSADSDSARRAGYYRARHADRHDFRAGGDESKDAHGRE